MDWQTIGKTVSQAAPLLGGLLSGSSEAATGAASLVASALGCSNNPESVMHALTENPEALNILKEIERQNLSIILQWQTARIMATGAYPVKLRKKMKKGGKGRIFWLSVFIFLLAFGTQGAILLFGYPQAIPTELVERIMATLDSIAKMLFSFWFGASFRVNNNEEEELQVFNEYSGE